MVEVLRFFFCSKYYSQFNFVVGGTCINGTFSLIPTYNNILLMEQIRPKKQLRLVVYPIIYWVSYMLGGARLLPSTVLHLMSWWKQMTQSTFSPSPPRAELFVDPSTSLSAWKATWKKKQRHIESCLQNSTTGWWFPSTHLKNIILSNWIISPRVRGEN